jgi:hypothetical protein
MAWRNRSNCSLVLALFGISACAQVLELDELDFSEGTGSSGGAQSEAGGDGPLEAGQGGSSGRRQSDGGQGGNGGASGDGASGLGGGGASGSGGGAPPCVSALSDLTVPLGENSSAYIPVAIDDPDTPVEELVLSAVSSNAVVVRSNEDIQIEGSGGRRYVNIAPRQSTGKTTITLTVSDGELQSSSIFELEVTNLPIVTGLFDMGSVKNVPLRFAVQVSDDITPQSDIEVSATSSNLTLLPEAGIDIWDDGYARSFTLTFAPDQTGTTIVTVTARDDSPNALATIANFQVTVVEAAATEAELVSRAGESGPIGDSYSDTASLSSDGHYVAFVSRATNLVLGDDSGADAFVWDRLEKTIRRVTPGLGDSTRPVISGDGQTVAFQNDVALVLEDADDASDVYAIDPLSNLPELVSVRDDEGPELAGGLAYAPISLSDDGRFVSFTSNAPLVEGDDNGKADIYERDRSLGTTTRMSVSSTGIQANEDSFQASMSADGEKVVFESQATNLIDGFTDPDSAYDIFLRSDGLTRRVSQNPESLEHGNGDSNGARLSADGSVVVFDSSASNLIGCDENAERDVFAYVVDGGAIELISVPLDGLAAGSMSFGAAVSGDGRYVVYQSRTDLTGVAFDAGYHVYVRDRFEGTTKLVDRPYAGHYPNGMGFNPAISADGEFVAFTAIADNIVLYDDNFWHDVFVVPRP